MPKKFGEGRLGPDIYAMEYVTTSPNLSLEFDLTQRERKVFNMMVAERLFGKPIRVGRTDYLLHEGPNGFRFNVAKKWRGHVNTGRLHIHHKIYS